MPRVHRMRSNTGFYHVMLRGNERKNIFINDGDKLRFIETVYEKKQEGKFYLHSFCLMNNHVHLMLSEGQEDISQVMKRITVSYVRYFNNKYKRVGHLFQDRFKSQVVEKESYVLSLVRYIHQNPVKAGIVRNPADYRWSSYHSYLDKDNSFAKMVDINPVIALFSNDPQVAKKVYEEFMNVQDRDELTETFLEYDDETMMEEEAAQKLFEQMLEQIQLEPGLETKEKISKSKLPASLIKEFKAKTNLPIRKIAEITGLNKDRIHKMLQA